MATNGTTSPTATPARFVPGKSYVHGWIGDADLKTVYTVLARTEKQVTIQQRSGEPKRVTVKVVDGAECCFPNGRYSMAPTLRADRPAMLKEQAPAYLCLQCMEWTPDPHAICEDCRKAGYINSQTESAESQPTSDSVDPAEALKSFSVFSRLLGLAYLASPEGSREEDRLLEALEDCLGGEERAEELLGLLPQEAGDGIGAHDVRLAFPVAS